MTHAQDDRLAIITGGGTGLGLATGLELRRRNWRVLALGLDTEPGLEGSGIEFERMDITDADALGAVARRTPRLHLLANAAGIILHDEREHTLEGFRRVVDVNLHGTQLACTLLRPALAAAGGSILNFASMWSRFGSGRNPGYSASKGAVEALTRALAVAYAAQGVRVNAVAPGYMLTPFSQRLIDEGKLDAQRVRRRTPAGRFGTAQHIADAVLFLASDRAEFITGVTLPVDGGYMAWGAASDAYDGPLD